ncbi:MAG: cbb3-type cytochrome c oxidase subunit I, partial [Acidimicrobiales bacterium]
MAQDTAEVAGSSYPGEVSIGRANLDRRPDWLKPHMGWAMVGAVVGWFFGRYVGDLIAGSWPVSQNTTMNNVAVVFALSFGVLGWLIGIGGLTYPFLKMLGREPAPVLPTRSWVRYFRMTEDHKVVGLQYLVGVLVFLFTAGLLAMGIRTELLSPTSHVFGPGTYIALVGEHGTMMMMMASSAVVGPLGNWLIPLMIGSRRMAYPRIEAFSFWVFMAGYLVIMTALPLGGFPTGWTGYAPVQ